jgi:hypothetical protein
VDQDPALMRGCDEPVIAGDTTRFRSCTGWTPEIDLVGTLQDMLDWWRNRLVSSSPLQSPGTEPFARESLTSVGVRVP